MNMYNNENTKIIKLEDQHADLPAQLNEEVIGLLTMINEKIDKSQSLVDKGEVLIQKLLDMISQKDELIKNLENENQVLNQAKLGDKQLINKLIGDMERLNQDIDWYKKTYEKRSLIGTFKQKLFK